MSAADLAPYDEEDRLAAVRRYDILDTPPDGAFDRVTALAARFCEVPISTISIVDHDRIWFKSASGVEVDEVGRDPGLCASAVMQFDPYVVTDAAVDPRALENPLVRGELGLRFYAGIPLTTSDGHNLGTLNVIDVEPREVTEEQLATLRDLAAIVVDELELRLAARRTVELEAVRRAASVRDAIVAGVSHEMLTPIAVLRGALDLLDDPGGVPENLRPLVRRQLAHLDWLVNQFLAFVRIEDHNLPSLRAQPTDVVVIATGAADVLTEEAAIRIEPSDDVPLARADPDRTRQILLELMSNAVRFSPAGAPVNVAIRGDDATVRVTVSDRGPGIARDRLTQLFEAFRTGPSGPGTGIGLYVSRALAEAQGGRIEVESVEGEGSAFTLVLPAEPGGGGGPPSHRRP